MKKKTKRDTYGAKPSGTRVVEEPRDSRGGKDSPKREAIEQTFEQIESILQEVSYQKYAFIATKIGEHI